MVEGLGVRMDSIERLRSSLRTSLFRNSFFLLLSSALGSILGFLFWLVVARAYPPSDVGLGGALFSVILFLAGAATLGMNYGLIRFLPTETDKASLLNAALVVSGIASLVLGLVFLAGLDLWAPSLAVVRAYLSLAALVLLSIVGFALGAVLDSAFLAGRHADYGTVRSVVFGLVRLPIPLFVAAALGFLGILVSWTLALVVSLAVGAFLFLPKLMPGYRPVPAVRAIRGKGIVAYSLWNHAAGIVGTVPMSLLPVVILNTAPPAGGAVASAYFFIAAAIAGVLYVIPGAFTTSLFVEGSHPEASYARDTRHTISFSLVLLGLGILAAFLLGRWLLSFFGPGYAAEGYEALVLFALASPVVLANSVFGTHLRVDKRVRPIFVITTTCSIVTLALAFVFLPMWGIAGAAGAYVMGQVIAAPLFAVERRRNGTNVGGRAGG